MLTDLDQNRTNVGFTYSRLLDTLLLYSNLSDNAHGVKEAAYHLACIMEDIESEPLPWTFQQAMCYLSAVSITRRIYRRKTKIYSLVEHGRDSTYMLFANAFGGPNFKPLITPEELHSRVMLELMDQHDVQYDKVLYAVARIIDNGGDSTKLYSGVPVVRRIVLQEIDFVRASKVA